MNKVNSHTKKAVRQSYVQTHWAGRAVSVELLIWYKQKVGTKYIYDANKHFRSPNNHDFGGN